MAITEGTKKAKARYEVIINTKKEYKNLKENIRILESKNHFKLIVAREISNYLSAVSRPWDTVHKADVNSKDLAKHLNTQFPEFGGGWEFRVLQSQGTFDIVFLGGGLIIELKSCKGKSRVMSNATVYPDTVTAKNGLANNFKYPTHKGLFQPVAGLESSVLDVLVVCVNYKEDVVSGYAIVDGNYWGVTEELFISCRDYFTDLNDIRDEINGILADSYDNVFAQALLDGSLGDAVDMKLRKLITLTNPVGRLSVLGRWGVTSS